jgi:hypothetical protein
MANARMPTSFAATACSRSASRQAAVCGATSPGGEVLRYGVVELPKARLIDRLRDEQEARISAGALHAA